jgi:hypothetical protein
MKNGDPFSIQAFLRGDYHVKAAAVITQYEERDKALAAW